jgi:hypothetical protein
MWLSRTTRAPAEREEARDRLANDGGAQVPDVHLLGGVGGAVVDDPGLSLVRGRGPELQASPRAVRLEPAEERRGPRLEVDEPGTRHAHLERTADVVAESRHEGLGDRPGRLSRPLGGRQDPVGLEVPVPRVGGAHARLERPGFIKPTFNF